MVLCFIFVSDLTFLANDIPFALYFTGVGYTHHSLPLLHVRFFGIITFTHLLYYFHSFLCFNFFF